MNDAWVYLDVATRRWVYRASSLGSCTRSLTAARLGESAAGPHANLRAAMDASAGLEDVILARAEEQLGVPIVGRQETVDLEVGVVIEGPDGKELRNVIVRGHPDGMTDDCIIEVKALGESNWEKASQPMGILGPDPLFAKYRIQGAAYGHATGKRVMFAIGHKVKVEERFGPGGLDGHQNILTGWAIDEVRLTDAMSAEELYPLDELVKRIRTIEEHAAIDELPECDGGCREGDPYGEVHFFTTPTVGDADLEKLLQRDKELEEAIAALQEERDELRKTVKESYAPGKYTAGKYTLNLIVKNPSRFDSKGFRKRHPDLYEEYKVSGMPYVEMKVT